MTDARYPERWLHDRRVVRLSDAAHRLYVTSLVWSVANRTDGVLYDDDLVLILRVDPSCAAELVEHELWRRDADHWVIVDFANTQTSSHDLAVLDNARRRDREKKARQRAAARRVSGTVPKDAPRDKTGDSTRPGQARPGQARRLEGKQVQTCTEAPSDDPVGAAESAPEAAVVASAVRANELWEQGYDQ